MAFGFMGKFFQILVGAAVAAALSGLFFGAGALLGRLDLDNALFPLSAVCALLLIAAGYFTGRRGEKNIFFGLISLPVVILAVLTALVGIIAAFGLNGNAAYYLKLNTVSFVVCPFSYYRFRFCIPYTLSLIAYYYGGSSRRTGNGTSYIRTLAARTKQVFINWKTILFFCGKAAAFNLFYSVLFIYMVNHHP